MTERSEYTKFYLGLAILAVVIFFVFILFGYAIVERNKPKSEADSGKKINTSNGPDPLITVVPEQYQNYDTTQLTISANDPKRGPTDAAVTMVIFSDFQCEFCKAARDTMYQLEKNFAGKLQIVWKDFPIPRVHPEGEPAAIAARCAQQQGKFWEYHDNLLENQTLLGNDLYTKIAQTLALDMDSFSSCVNNKTTQGLVQKTFIEGVALDISGTPFFFINKTRVSGAQSYSNLAGIVQQEIDKAALEIPAP